MKIKLIVQAVFVLSLFVPLMSVASQSVEQALYVKAKEGLVWVQLQSDGQNFKAVLVSAGDQLLDTALEIGANKKLKTEWENIKKQFLANDAVAGGFSVNAIGDHKPVSEFLDRVYKDLEKRLTKPVLELTPLVDIETLNFATPVAVQPKGDRRNGDRWSEADYVEHFIPFASISTYWISLEACKQAARSLSVPSIISGKICKRAAAELKAEMAKNIAPDLGVKIYRKP